MAGPSTGECESCKEALRDFKLHGKGPKYLTLHVAREQWRKPSKNKDEKKQRIDEFGKRVAALRNSKGGQLLIHLDGQHKDDWNHEWFDEIVVDKLIALIEDGQLFVDTYSSEWFVTDTSAVQHTGFLALTVTGTSALTTANFNTKLPTDVNVIDPSTINIIKVLQKAQVFDQTQPQLLGILGELTKLHESRQIQFKVFHPPNQLSTPLEFVDYIWENLRLREYMCAFARVKSGGSFFLGIQERTDKSNNYETKVPVKQGFGLEAGFKLASANLLQKKIDDNILICNYEGVRYTGTASQLQIFRAKFHEYMVGPDLKYILEVAVRPFSGFLFYNKTGPTTHRLNKQGMMIPVDFDDWFQKITEIRIGVKC